VGTGLGLTAASAGHAGDQLTVVASVVVGLHHWLERCRSLLYVKAARNLETRGLLCACVCRWLAAGRSNSAVRVMRHSGSDLAVLVARRCCRLPLTNVAPAADG
jgi:hypothetical protein